MDNLYSKLYDAIAKHNVKQVETLLNQKNINPTKDSNKALWEALEYYVIFYDTSDAKVTDDYVEIIKLLLNWKGPKWPIKGNWIDPRSEYPNKDHPTINYLVGQCPLKIVELFLNWKGPEGEWFDPRKHDNQVLGDAIIFSRDKKVVELLLNWTGPNGERIVPGSSFLEINYALKTQNEEIIAMLILWYIDHKRKKELEELASKLAQQYPLLKTMLQRYENTKAAFKATWKSLEKGVAKDLRKYKIGDMIKQSMFDPVWDISEKSKRPRLDDNNDNISMGGSKRKFKKRNLNRKKSIRKKSIKKNQTKRKKSMKKPIRKKPY